MHFTKPSDAYSFLHKAFLKASNGWEKYCEFSDWWGYDNFQTSDYVEEEYNDRTLMSTVEQAYIHYAKALTLGRIVTKDDPLGIGRRELDMTRITLFLQQLNGLIEKHPNYVYPPYYKAKLLLLQGGKEQALESFLPFAKQKKNDFWVWDLMADIFKDDKEKRMACFCKALTCRIPGSFLVKTRQRFAEFLIANNLYDEARFELDQLIRDREANGWRIPNVLLNWKGKEWYNSAKTKDSNKDFYRIHLDHAEDILFSSDPKQAILVAHVNKEKQMISYSIDKVNSGFFKYKGLVHNPEVGELYDVRIAEKDEESGFTRINTLEKSDKTEHSMLKEEEGKVRIKEGASYAFINDTFIDPNSVKKHNLRNEDKIRIKSILSFNKSKDNWGWKMAALIDVAK
jgi:tetratricopeptide (TPR) repeat protein